MGHLLFIILHVVAIMFGAVWLIITIPLHLIYGAVSGRKTTALGDPNAPTAETHVRCPDCKELVRADATKCKHCGTVLVPVDLSSVVREREESAARNNKAKLILAVICGLVIGVGYFMKH